MAKDLKPNVDFTNIKTLVKKPSKEAKKYEYILTKSCQEKLRLKCSANNILLNKNNTKKMLAIL